VGRRAACTARRPRPDQSMWLAPIDQRIPSENPSKVKAVMQIALDSKAIAGIGSLI